MIFPVLMGWMTACTGSAEAFLEKAKGELQKGKAKEAIEYLNQAIDKDAQSAAAFNMRGAAYFELKDYTNALLDYEQAIKLDASNYKPFSRANYDWKIGEMWQETIGLSISFSSQ